MAAKNKTYIIAEAGINHNGYKDNCYRLIDAAASAGCDCVKFQFFKAKFMYPRSAGKLDWHDERQKYSYNIYDAVQSFELPVRWIKYIMKYCAINKIDFLSSVFDKEGLTYLVKQGMKMIKISSYSITDLPLIEKCARYKIPIIMSTGGASLGEIESAVKTVNRFHNKLSFLHCSIKYPTELRNCNLGVIKTLRYAFPNNNIGYSDHTKEVSTAAVQAVYLGARIIEKHITLSKKISGPDHFFALEPHELKKMVKDIRQAEYDVASNNYKIDEKVYGTSAKVILKAERYLRNFCFATIFANKDIKRGQRIIHKDLCILRPGTKKRGIDSCYLDLFKRFQICATKDILKEEAINWEHILNA